MLADISSSTDNILFPTQATGSATLSLAVFAWRGSQEGLVSVPRIPPPALHLVPPLPCARGRGSVSVGSACAMTTLHILGNIVKISVW